MVDRGNPVAGMSQLRADVFAALGDPSGGTDAVARVCRACMELLHVDGVSISVISSTQHRETLYASDEIISRVESLQFTLGEGPCFEAFHTHRPVLVPELAQTSITAWPIFASEIGDLPIGAIFAFPIQHGAIGIGAIDLYRRLPGWLSEEELATALQLVDLAEVALLGRQSNGADGAILEAWLPHLPHSREEVHQATGMLIAKFSITAEQALSRLRGYAFVTGVVIEDVAHDITTRRLDLAELDN